MDEMLREKLARVGVLALAREYAENSLADANVALGDAIADITPDEIQVVEKEGHILFGGSALDLLAKLEPGDHGYVDAAGHPLMPSLDGLITYSDLHVLALDGQDEGPLTFIELGANGVTSSNVSAVGCSVCRVTGVIQECIFVRYKGGALYYFAPFDDGHSRWADIVTTIRQMKQALPTPLTVGEYIERNVKAAFEQGRVQCMKLEEGLWVPAKTKAELAEARRQAKAEKGPAHEGKGGEDYPRF